MKKDFFYVLGPYSENPVRCTFVFNRVKQEIMHKYGIKENQIFIPTEHIPSTCTWEESMRICEKEFESTTHMILIVNSLTNTSKGVYQELLWAEKKGIPVFSVIAFDSLENDSFNVTISNPVVYENGYFIQEATTLEEDINIKHSLDRKTL